MKEKFGQQPESPKQNAPEAGAIGIPPLLDPEPPLRGGGNKSPECQPLIGQGKSQSEPAEFNVSSANTEDTELSQAELKSKSPVIDPPKRRRRTGVAGGELHGYGKDESPRTSENKNPDITPTKRRGRQ